MYRVVQKSDESLFAASDKVADLIKQIRTLRAQLNLQAAASAKKEEAAVAAARDAVLVQAAAEEKVALRDARRRASEAEEARRAADKACSAAEACAAQASAAEQEAVSQLAAWMEEQQGLQHDLDQQLKTATALREQALASLRAEHRRALLAERRRAQKEVERRTAEQNEAESERLARLRAELGSARDALAMQASAAATHAEQLQARISQLTTVAAEAVRDARKAELAVHSERTKLGLARKTAEAKEARAAQLERQLERDRSLEQQLQAAYSHLQDRNQRIEDLTAQLQLPAQARRVTTDDGKCPQCGRGRGVITIPHLPGTLWPMWRCDVARRVMQEGHVDPKNLSKVLSGAFTFLTGELPTEEHMCDEKFGTRCYARLGALDNARARNENAKDPHGSFFMSDGGAGDRKGVSHTANSQMHVQLQVSYHSDAVGPIIKPLGLKVTPRDTGAHLAKTNIAAFEQSGCTWAGFSGCSGDHTEHSSGVAGERALMIEHAVAHGCAPGRADSFGCLRHGHQLVNGAGLKALWTTKGQCESEARLIWENICAEHQTNAKQWLAAGLPEALWNDAVWTEPTTSKWGVMEAWAVKGWSRWNVMVTVKGVRVHAHVHFAQHMCSRLRGSKSGDYSDAGGDRLRKWEMHLGIVLSPVHVALFTALLDFNDYFDHRHGWCLRADGEFGWRTPFHAREVVVKMCEDESKLKAAVDNPALLFDRMAKYINSPSSHTTVLSASDKEGLTTCMAAAAKAMYDKHRDWNWPQWTRARLLFGAATDETYRESFVQALLPLVGAGQALADFMAHTKTPAAAMPDDDVGPHLTALLSEHAEDLKEQWRIWSLGDHLDDWLLLATAPHHAKPPVGPGTIFRRSNVPGLWTVFISMIFIVPTDNTPCEQRVSVYRHEVSQNQSEWTVEAQWMYACRMQPERERLVRLRSTTSRYLDAKARERAAAGKQLSGHARSKLQLSELWRWALQTAYGYTAAEAQLHKVARLVREIRQRRRDAHDTAQAREVQMLTLTCSRGAAGGRRRAAITAEDAVRYCPSLAELGLKGRGNFTAAGVKAQIRQAKEQIKAAETEQKQAASVAAAARAETQRKRAAEKKAAADDTAAQGRAVERVRVIEESDERISRMWANAPQSDSDEANESSDEEDDDDDDDDGDDVDSGVDDDHDDDDDDVDMDEGEEGDDDALGQAIQEEATALQRSAEQRAATALVDREARREARSEAMEERRRLTVQCLQKRTIVMNYWLKRRTPLQQRTPESLLSAPREVQVAFEELQQLEARQKALHV